MGFHIIIPLSDGPVHYYIEEFKELAYIDDINDESLIYEAPRSQIPQLLKNYSDSEAQKYLGANYRLGIKTEDIFIKQAKERKFIVHPIDQTLEDYNQYKNSINDDIKRADFLIKNAGVEVDVKCRSIYESSGNKYFYLRADDIRKHLNMMKHTKVPVIIAVYARHEDGPDENELFMIEINAINAAIGSNLISLTKNEYYAIPLSLTVEGFELLKRFKN